MFGVNIRQERNGKKKVINGVWIPSVIFFFVELAMKQSFERSSNERHDLAC